MLLCHYEYFRLWQWSWQSQRWCRYGWCSDQFCWRHENSIRWVRNSPLLTHTRLYSTLLRNVLSSLVVRFLCLKSFLCDMMWESRNLYLGGVLTLPVASLFLCLPSPLQLSPILLYIYYCSLLPVSCLIILFALLIPSFPPTLLLFLRHLFSPSFFSSSHYLLFSL